ncbi:pilus assembly protein PilP [Parashewanella tropica]|uniref:pilus assembly protein PilP n=1 Tax=Parashewanella tropica TaxID=2547970 RepID=UPI00105A6B27|nr:pilus assembly protein PilP [Parashewanella tropica]
MKRLILLTAFFALTGCSKDRTDLELFVTTTKAQHVAHIPAIKEAPKFEHFAYHAELLRSPFSPPSRELTEEVIDSSKNCLQPDLARRKSRLETYALDNLKMRGSITQDGRIWALIETSDGSIYRSGTGQFLGLYHGQIVRILDNRIDIIELIPDGSGCWTERISAMELTSE